jgi:hypothetical protein
MIQMLHRKKYILWRNSKRKKSVQFNSKDTAETEIEVVFAGCFKEWIGLYSSEKSLKEEYPIKRDPRNEGPGNLDEWGRE